jgi:uncharacterized protein (DUF983 family)
VLGGAFRRGVSGKCPACGAGKLYRSYLRLNDACPACAADFRAADSGDGPAVFVIFVVGALVVPLAFVLQFGFGWPIWASAGAGVLATLLLSLWLLPVFKGALFGLQWAHKAGEGRLES